jgi:hypothetical protein
MDFIEKILFSALMAVLMIIVVFSSIIYNHDRNEKKCVKNREKIIKNNN